MPQGTVLGPLLFLLSMNDITNVDSHLRLFADGCLLYEEVNYPVMAERLEKNLDLLCEGAEKWQM